MRDQDSPWKELLDARLAEALAFFAPAVHGDIDWSRDHEPLDQELRKLVPDSHTGKRIVDKLVKVFTKQGDERYLHLEVQSAREPGFEERVYTYNYRLRDRFNQPVCSVPILTDDDLSWRPNRHVEEVWGTRIEFTFQPVKVRDWAGQEEQLARAANLVGLFVLAHLASPRTRDDPAARAAEKVQVILRLYERALDAEEVRQWYRYFDWLLDLPAKYDRQVWEQVARSKEKAMPYVTFAERYGREKGEIEGRRVGLLEGIRTLLEVKFQDQGLALLPSVEPIDSPDTLKVVLQRIKESATVEDARAAVTELATADLPTDSAPSP